MMSEPPADPRKPFGDAPSCDMADLPPAEPIPEQGSKAWGEGKPWSGKPPAERRDLDRSLDAETQTFEAIICPNCNTLNVLGEMKCFRCGYNLVGE